MSFARAYPVGWRLILAIPAGLIAMRIALGPLLVIAAFAGVSGPLCATMLVVFLSDVLDGVIARAASCTTPGLRRADSADVGSIWPLLTGTARQRGDLLARIDGWLTSAELELAAA